MNDIWDISLPLSSKLPVWPGNQRFALQAVHRLSNGAHCNESAYSGNIHTGTHIDVPWHFLEDGGKTESVSFDQLIGKATVVAVPEVDQIDRQVLESLEIHETTRRLLFKTRNSLLWANDVSEFQPDFVALTVDAAEWLAERHLYLVGIDYLSIQPFRGSNKTHETLLNASIVILEGLNLHGVEAGDYELLCLPLAISGAEGAPARAVLRRPTADLHGQ